MMRADQIDQLRAAQSALADASRAIDAATVRLRTLLELLEREDRARQTPKPETDGD